jgi:hypothetical protein
MAASDPLQSHGKTELGSDRNFGIVFAVVFAVIGLLPLVHGGDYRLWAIIVATVFAGVAAFAPGILHPLNRLWYRFGLLLHHVVNPIIMGLIFFGAFLPMALIVRATGKDLLRLNRDPEAKSYWLKREPPGPAARSMTKQF